MGPNRGNLARADASDFGCAMVAITIAGLASATVIGVAYFASRAVMAFAG